MATGPDPAPGADPGSIDLGDVRIDRVVDLDDCPFAASDIYPDATPEAIADVRDALPPGTFEAATSSLRLSFHALLVRAAGLTVLVDTCCGNDKHRPQRPAWHARRGPFLDALARAGTRPPDVDLVLCTHLHADHVGWNTRLENGRWVPTFPNARYLFAETEYRHWQAAHERAGPGAPVLYGAFEDSVLPVMRAGQAELVAADASPAAGVHLEPAPGHTPGNVLVRIEGRRRTAILCGDVLHHPVQLLRPHWSTRFCADPERSRRTRVALLERTADTGDAVLPAHFRAPAFGRVLRDGAAYRYEAIGGERPGG